MMTDGERFQSWCRRTTFKDTCHFSSDVSQWIIDRQPIMRVCRFSVMCPICCHASLALSVMHVTLRIAREFRQLLLAIPVRW